MKKNKRLGQRVAGTFGLLLLILIPSLSSAQVDFWLPIGIAIPTADPILSIALDPDNPDIIYMGSTGSKFFFTTDAGASWNQIFTFPGNYNILDLLVHPNNSNTLIAVADSGGMFISFDQGATWNQRINGMADTVLTQVIINARYPDTLFVIGQGGVFRSKDLGITWSSRNDGLSADSVNVTAIGNARIDPATMYVGTSNGRIYRSDNYGITWSLRGSIAGAGIITITVDNLDPDIVYAGTANDGVQKSIDGGLTWSIIPSDNAATDSLKVLSMALDTSSTRKLYVGTNGNGVFQVNIGDNFLQAINQGLNNGRIYDLTVNPVSPHIIYCTTDKNLFYGVYKYIGNRAPVIAPIGRIQANAGIPVTFTVTATDPDPGETVDLVYNVDSLPSTATFDSLATHVFFWIPAESDTGDNEIIFKVHDLRGGSDEETVIINVNRIPAITIADTLVTGREDSTIIFIVTGTDVDGDSLSFGASTLPSGATFINSGTNEFTFTWSPDFDQAGTYLINFTVSDGRTGVTIQPVRFTIANTNQPPFFDPPLVDKSVLEGTTLAFIVRATDLDGDPITFGTWRPLPAGAGFDSVDTKRFSWIPTFKDSGSYNVSFTLDDGQGGFTVDSVTVKVINVNRPPVFSELSDTMYVNEGESLSVTLIAVDADSDSVFYNAANLPTGATLNKTTGHFFWIPNFSQEGSYRVVFNALDNMGGASFEEVIIIVNQPPVWSQVSGQFTQEGVTLSFKLFASDADGDSLAYSVENLPENAVITFPGDSVLFTWTPGEGQEGMYAVTFVVNDGRSGSDEVIIPIQVAASTGQLPPTIIPTQDITVNENQLVIFQVVATDDSPPDSLIFGTVGSLPSGAEYDSTNTHIFQWTPSYAQSGTYNLIFSVTDNYANVTIDTVVVTVVNVNRIPTTTLPDDTTFFEGESISLPLNITDPDGESLSIIYIEIPFGAVIDSTGAHTLVWTPTYLQEGTFRLRFTASDPLGGILNHTLTITISNSNRAPAPFNIIFPTSGKEVKLDGFLIWEQAQDLDIYDTVSYSLDIDDDSTFGSIEIHIDTVNNYMISSGMAPKTANNKNMQLMLTNREAFVLLLNDIPDIDQLILNSILIDDEVYYWRVRAFDNRGGQTGYTATDYFHLNLGNDPPLPPGSGFYPGEDEPITNPQPVFRWAPSQDPDYSDDFYNISYAFELSDNNFISGYQYRLVTETGIDSIASPVVLSDNEAWYYRIKAYDDEGDSSVFSNVIQFFSNTLPEPPAQFSLISPFNNFDFFSRPDSLMFNWEDSFDPDPGDDFTYRLELSIDNTFSPPSIILYVDDIPNTTSSYTMATVVLEKATYYWRVLAVDENNMVTPSREVWMFGLITSIEEDMRNSHVPTKFTVEQNYPNPFNNQTAVRFGLPNVTNVKINIFTITGRLVYEENHTNMSPGYHLFRWNGKSSSQQPASSGVYLLVISTNREIKSQKIVLIK